MLRSDDIDAAVAAGIITAGQAAQLQRIASERHRRRSFALGREERFRLLGGFGDFFIAVGVLLLGIGLFYGASLFRGDVMYGPTVPGLPVIAWLTFGVGVMWGLAEYLTGRLKLVAPSIVVVVVLALLAGAAAIACAANVYGINPPNQAVYGAIAALAVALLHYGRFRFPFTLLVIAVSGVIVVVLCYSILIRALTGLSEREITGHLLWVAFALGVLTFGAAMWFDTSDPERLTRRADCAFWLHIVAAPLIVHPLAGPLISHPVFGTGGAASGGTSPLLVFPLMLVLALVALILDRRALLVAGLGYLGAAMTYSISRLSGEGRPAVLATLLALGLLIIVLGVGWRDVRGQLMRHLPDFPFKTKLPPYAPA